jgi:hypothetical protein
MAQDGRIYGENNVTGETVELAPKALCSMNMWGFTPDYFDKSEEIFTRFLEKNVNELKAFAMLEVAYFYKIFSEGQVCKRGAVIKGIAEKGLYAVANLDTLKVRAISEGIPADLGHVVGDYNAPQRRAILKCTILNLCDVIWNNQVGKKLAAYIQLGGMIATFERCQDGGIKFDFEPGGNVGNAYLVNDGVTECERPNRLKAAAESE